MSEEPRDRVIRLPKVTASRKRAYLEAARGQPLAEWMLDQCDQAVLAGTLPVNEITNHLNSITKRGMTDKEWEEHLQRRIFSR